MYLRKSVQLLASKLFPRFSCFHSWGSTRPCDIDSILTWSLPFYTHTGVQKFLSLASYNCNFTPGFSCIAAPNTNLLRKEKQVVLTKVETVAKTRIDYLISFLVLALTDFNKPLFPTTHANNAARVMLSQQANNSKKPLIVACYSHRFTSRRQSYPVHQKELYALWWGFTKCTQYLCSRHLTIQTSYQSILHLTKSFQDFDNAGSVKRLERLLQCDLTVK